MMETNSKIAPRKDLILTKLKIKKRRLRSKRLHLKVSANFAKKFWEIKLKRYKLDID